MSTGRSTEWICVVSVTLGQTVIKIKNIRGNFDRNTIMYAVIFLIMVNFAIQSAIL